ncbi:MAG: amidohydrolase family protein [Candidatus Lokiarchaeota archaeon]
MNDNKIFSQYGLIGSELELRKNVTITKNGNGRIKKIESEEPEDYLSFSYNRPSDLIIPGLINSHVHIGDSFAKEFGYNRGLIEIVAPPDGLKHRLLNSVSEKVIIHGIRKALNEMTSNGITCFIDFREGGLQGVKLLKGAIKNSTIRTIIFGRFNSEKEISKVLQLADGIGLSSYSSISEVEKNILEKSKLQSNKLIACHVAELKRNLNLFNEILQDDLIDIFVHGTQFQRYELERIKKKSLILCPRSNAYFGVGLPPINEIFDLKIPIALGTDNIMANSPNLFEELRFTYYILKGLNKKLPKDLFHSYIIQRTNSNNIKQVYIGGNIVFER